MMLTHRRYGTWMPLKSCDNGWLSGVMAANGRYGRTRVRRFLGGVCVLGAIVAVAVPGIANALADGAARPVESGSVWRVIYRAPTRYIHLVAVAAPGRRDAWAVGVDHPPRRQAHGLVLHWDGRDWRPASIPVMGPRFIPFSVAASSPGNVWIFVTRPVADGGQVTEALRWDGISWHVEPAPPPGYSPSTVVLGRADAWDWTSTCSSTGGAPVSCTTTTWHWNGATWTADRLPVAADEVGAGNGVAGAGNRVWFDGAKDPQGTFGPHPSGLPVVYRWSGRWRLAFAPRVRSGGSALAAAPSGQAWLLTIPVIRGTVRLYHWNGGRWTGCPVPAHVAGQPFILAGQNLTYDGHDGVWAGPYAHWTGRRWINALAFAQHQGIGLDDGLAPIPGTPSVWATGAATQTGQKIQHDVIAIYGKIP